MRRVFLMAAKDLLRRRRAPLGVLVTLAFPLIFAGLLAVTFGGKGDRMPRVRLLVEDQDGGLVGRLLLGGFGSEQMSQYVEAREVEKGSGEALMEGGEASALLVIPEGFTRAVIDGKPASLRLVRNPAESILPEVAEQIARMLTDVLSGASHVLREPLDEISASIREDRSPAESQVARIAILVQRTITNVEDLLFPPAIQLETAMVAAPERQRSGSSTTSIFLFVLPGVSVFSLFMLGDYAMRDLLAEGTAGTLRRQLGGPISTRTLVTGKAVYTAFLSGISLLILSTFGWIVAKAHVSLPAFTGLSLALVVAVTGFAALTYGAARSERQGSTFAALIALVMAFAGGSFVPLDSLPAGFRRVAPFSLFYWGTDGYQRMLFEDAGLGDVLPGVAVLGGVGLLLLAAGAFLLGRKVRRGGAR